MQLWKRDLYYQAESDLQLKTVKYVSHNTSLQEFTICITGLQWREGNKKKSGNNQQKGPITCTGRNCQVSMRRRLLR